VKLIRRQVADGEMAKIQVADRPSARPLRGRELDSLPEKSELISEGTLHGVAQVAGEVPPFCFEIRVGAVIARKHP
jgi:hypothetical protein